MMGHAYAETTLQYVNISMVDVAAEFHRAAEKLELRYEGSLAALETTLVTNDASLAAWTVIDTGANSSLHITNRYATSHGLPGDLARLGTSRSSGVGALSFVNDIVLLPTLKIGAFELNNVPTHIVADAAGDHVGTGLLGMEVLQRLHLYIDYAQSQAFLKPSGSWAVPYRDLASMRVAPTLGIGLATLVIAGVWIALWVRRIRQRKATEPNVS